MHFGGASEEGLGTRDFEKMNALPAWKFARAFVFGTSARRRFKTEDTEARAEGLAREKKEGPIRRSAFPGETSSGEGEDEEVAFAGDDHGYGVAVGGDGKFAEREAVKNGYGRGLRNGDFFFGVDGGEWRDRNPDDVAGFLFKSALEEDA